MAKVDKLELGKGIRALLGDTKPPETIDQEPDDSSSIPVRLIHLDQIEINPFQPRNDFDAEALEELTDSIKTFGLIQPVTIRKLDGEKYQLIAGERRLRASRMAGLQNIPAFLVLFLLYAYLLKMLLIRKLLFSYFIYNTIL